ncbi:hypothetical protein BGZ65_012344, partial [Modicella reniformis]
MTSPPTALSPNLGSSTSPSSITTHEHAGKLDQLDPSAQAAAAASWPQRYFGPAKDVHITFDQPSPEQMMQQQMLNQSRLLMQNMAARDLAAAENNNFA